MAETNRRGDGLEKVTPFKHGNLLVSMLDFWGVIWFYIPSSIQGAVTAIFGAKKAHILGSIELNESQAFLVWEVLS